MKKTREYHASEIDCFKTCPRMYYYQYVERIVPKVKDVKLWFGTGVHYALERYYGHGEDPFQAFSVWANDALASMSHNCTSDQLHEFCQSVELGKALMSEYATWAAQTDDFQVLHTEVPFRVPVRHPKTGRATGAHHVGILDALVRDRYGRVWVMDHKTASSFPDERLLRLDEQMGFYVLAAVQLFPDVEIAGALYNVIRKADPRRAKSEVFRRYKILYNAAQIARLRERLYYAVRAIRQEKQWEPHPQVRGSGHCTWKCGYRLLCIAEEDGSDVQALINGLYEQRTAMTV